MSKKVIDVSIQDNNNNEYRAKMEINNSLPIFIISNPILNNHTYQKATVTNKAPNNSIVVITTGTKLTYIASIKNPYTDIISSLFYNKDDNELLLTTHPDYYILDGLIASNQTIQAYSIGVLKESTFADTISYPYKYINLPKLTISSPSKYNTISLNIHGIKTKKPFLYKENSGSSIYKELNLIPMLQLDRASVLGDVSLPVYTLDPIGSYRFRARFYGNKKHKYVYIPLVI